MKDQLEARLKELEASRVHWAQALQQASVNLQQHEGAIAELRRLLAALGQEPAKEPQRRPDWRDGIETK